jgi:pyruvate/2-oxoglutarate dehydrogenase complex dihydrolipoamide acyltransferase (E2) component
MALVEYVGKSYGTQSFYGPSTGIRYQFGLTKNKIQNVDPEDLRTNSPSRPGFLELREGGAPIFRVVEKSVVKATVPSKAELVAFEKAVEELKADERVVEISKAAQKLAEESGMTTDDMYEYITGTGKNGNITVSDVRTYLGSQ